MAGGCKKKPNPSSVTLLHPIHHQFHLIIPVTTDTTSMLYVIANDCPILDFL